MVVRPLGLRERILPRVSRPNRYIAPFSYVENAKAHICLLYPGPYRRALAHPGFRSLLDALRSAGSAETAVDLCLRPEEDLEGLLAEEGLPLFGLASERPLQAFDLVLVFADGPEDVPTALRMLHRGGCTADSPVYLCGPVSLWGPSFGELFRGVLTGDAECYREEILAGTLARADGVWRAGAPAQPDPRWLSVMPPVIDEPWVPMGELEPEGAVLEIARRRGPRDLFYGAGTLFRRGENVLRASELLFSSTGSPVVLWGGDEACFHPELIVLLERLHSRVFARHHSAALSRVHPALLEPALARELNKSRRGALKFMPIALSENLRAAGGNPLPDGQLLEALQLAARGGWPYVELPVLVGAPQETEADRGQWEAFLGSLTQPGIRRTLPKTTLVFQLYVPKPGSPTALLDSGTFRSWVLGLRERFKKAGRVKITEEDPRASALAYRLLQGGPQVEEALRAHAVGAGPALDLTIEAAGPAVAALPVPEPVAEISTEDLLPLRAPSVAGRGNGRRVRRGAAKQADRYRIRYCKEAPLRFASHLEIARALERGFLGARLPLAWSQGKDPRPKMAFGPSLPVGMTSEAEYLDIFLTRETGETFVSAVNARLPRGLALSACSPIRNEAASLGGSVDVAAYHVSFPSYLREEFPSSRELRESLESEVRNVLDSNSLPITKTKKEKTLTINVRPTLLSAAVTQDSHGYPAFTFRIRLNRADTVRPESLAAHLCRGMDFDERTLLAHRTGLFVSGGQRDLDPMQVIQPEFAWWREPLRSGASK